MNTWTLSPMLLNYIQCHLKEDKYQPIWSRCSHDLLGLIRIFQAFYQIKNPKCQPSSNLWSVGSTQQVKLWGTEKSQNDNQTSLLLKNILGSLMGSKVSRVPRLTFLRLFDIHLHQSGRKTWFPLSSVKTMIFRIYLSDKLPTLVLREKLFHYPQWWMVPLRHRKCVLRVLHRDLGLRTGTSNLKIIFSISRTDIQG